MRARGGGIGFVYPGSNMQLVAETHIVMILYGATTLGAILLIKCEFKLLSSYLLLLLFESLS